MASSPLQNRLVGTVIVVALAVIILPDLFGNAGQSQSDDFQITPLSPSIESHMQSPNFPADFSASGHSAETVIAVPITEDGTGDNETMDDQLDIKELASPVDLGSTTPTQVQATAGERWVIQLGAFRNVDTVNALLEKLRAAGFSADSRILRRPEGQLHLVLVGPDLNEQVLVSQLEPLKKLTELEGKVVPYRPAKN